MRFVILFSLNVRLHERLTRNEYDLFIKCYRTQKGKRSYSYCAAVLWNKFNKNLKLFNTISYFNIKLKYELMHNNETANYF